MTSSIFKSSNRPPSEAADLPEIDVTPIMNMFVILIPFLVSMAVFTHLSILEFTLPPNIGSGLINTGEKPKLKMTIVVTENYVAITHGETMLDSINLVNGSFDYNLIAEKISQYREKIEIKDEVIIAIRDKVKFKRIVSIMDKCKEAGFKKLGMSNATEDPLKGV